MEIRRQITAFKMGVGWSASIVHMNAAACHSHLMRTDLHFRFKVIAICQRFLDLVLVVHQHPGHSSMHTKYTSDERLPGC